MRRLAVLFTAALVVATASIGARSDPLAGRVAGPMKDCLDLDRAQAPDIVDATTILYRQSGKRIWKTEPVGTCPALRPLSTLIVEVYGKQMCRGDRFRVLDNGMSIPSGYCRFGGFTPYDKP